MLRRQQPVFAVADQGVVVVAGRGLAVDQAATPAERQVAYKRVREELDGLISLSDDAVDRLEKKVALEITPGTPPPTRPVVPPCGTMGTPAARQALTISETSCVEPGRTSASASPL